MAFLAVGGADDVELDSVHEGVLADRLGVGRRGRSVSTSGSPVRAWSSAVIDANGTSSMSSTSMVTDPLR